jgi:LPS sulfotransferase NodH
MSKPFFVWTMRRTGGTSLTSLLSTISEYPGMEHEPFNADRKLGGFIRKFRSGVDRKILAGELDELFSQHYLIKHCYELFGEEFNYLIASAVIPHDYKHLFLRREDEVSRIVSLYLARQTSVWGPEQKKDKYEAIISGREKLEPFDIASMKEHLLWCKNITSKIKNYLSSQGMVFKEISYEEFYTGDRETRFEKLVELFQFLEFDDDVMERYSNLIEEKIFNSSQNSQSILEFVPNYKEALEILNHTWREMSQE